MIFLTRHGESIYNTLGKIGGNSGLSEKGQAYSKKLADYFNTTYNDLIVYTSNLDRTLETANYLVFNKTCNSCLNEINAGICEELTYEEIKIKYPVIHKNRSLDKLNYRYPKGESYSDLIKRVSSFVNELKKLNNKNVLLIAHQAVLRVILGIINNTPYKDIPYLSIPLHVVHQLSFDDKFNIINTNLIKFEGKFPIFSLI